MRRNIEIFYKWNKTPPHFERRPVGIAMSSHIWLELHRINKAVTHEEDTCGDMLTARSLRRWIWKKKRDKWASSPWVRANLDTSWTWPGCEVSGGGLSHFNLRLSPGPDWEWTGPHLFFCVCVCVLVWLLPLTNLRTSCRGSEELCLLFSITAGVQSSGGWTMKSEGGKFC